MKANVASEMRIVQCEFSYIPLGTDDLRAINGADVISRNFLKMFEQIIVDRVKEQNK